MKQLVCEMCGGTDLVKDGGVFICQTCGCKYTVEEAKKMMVEGTVDVTGTVRIDRSAEQKKLIENYLSMCENASDASDTETVVEYSDKILEIDPDNYKAWMYRALSCGWKSSLNDMKTGQVITAAKKALDLAPEEEKYDLAEKIFIQAKLQIIAHMNRVFSLTSTALLTMSLTMSAKQAEMIAPVMSGWVRLVTEIPYLSSERMENEIKDCKAVEDKHTVIVATAADCFNGKKKYYETMTELLKEKIETASRERDEMYARRREAYWSEHTEEKAALDSERISIQSQIEDLNNQIDTLPENTSIADIESQIASKAKEKDGLGVFKGKEKKALQAQIDDLNSRLSDIKKAKDNAVAPLNESISKLQERIKEIDAELTKNR